MANMTGMVDAFLGQIANPDCSYLTGMMMGSAGMSRIIISFFLILLAFRILDKLAIEPLLSWIKDKIYKKKTRK